MPLAISTARTGSRGIEHPVFLAPTAGVSGGTLAAVGAAGGPVLNATARGAAVAEAQRRAYAPVDRIDWPGRGPDPGGRPIRPVEAMHPGCP